MTQFCATCDSLTSSPGHFPPGYADPFVYREIDGKEYKVCSACNAVTDERFRQRLRDIKGLQWPFHELPPFHEGIEFLGEYKRRWYCACGWSGYVDDMIENPSGGYCCPKCGGSGGLISEADAHKARKDEAADSRRQ